MGAVMPADPVLQFFWGSGMDKSIDRSLRVLRILEFMASAQHPQTLSQLAQRTGLPKTSVMRMLEALERRAYVARIPGRGGYVSGPRAHQLSLSILQTPHLLRACRSVLGKLVAVTRETCNLNALNGDFVQYLVRVEAQDPMRLQLHMDIGARVPLHCTASGKLFLALTPQPYRNQILERLELSACTPRTLTQRAALEAELALIRAQEMGVDNEEFVRGMVAIAVPVRDAQGIMIAALACHGPTAETSLKDLLAHTGPMRQAAQELSALFTRE